MRGAPHFTLAEFACHDGTPVPLHARRDVERLCQLFLEPLRSQFGPVTIVSGYRTAPYNRAVHGAPDSWHVYRRGRPGAAADVVCKLGTAADWYQALSRMDPGGLGRYSEHVHVDTRRGRARW